MMRGGKSPHRGDSGGETHVLLDNVSDNESSDQSSSADHAPVDYDTALDRAGFGRYQPIRTQYSVFFQPIRTQ